ncbi:DUF368 domain-containing protein [Pseudoalteromonas denitrificans]|uniref:Putative membrane protein n=1 Tax=Pseudoalteromonas denitrificans DSM 6059 TaxID=1123010 RepID=A0A1I1GWQ1_9GAMM|nr:DUF368 domain-containing protein [Pseudoalteromonas denitrificans]SFC15981.1 putative membrane protein [Pseudoalteromonas denitrificans DSM 6059]
MSQTKQTKRDFLFLFFKGAAMGAADVVPGVSGGTIAFITGIYERLLNAIQSVNLDAAKLMCNRGNIITNLKSLWQHIDGNFLLAVFSGLITSGISLAKVITYLLSNHPIYVWSFFFGLIIASFIHIAKQINTWNIKTIASCIFGALLAYVITTLSPSDVDPQWWFYTASGAIAICAMILPGISGSFILLLLGMYAHVLTAVNTLAFDLIALFILGCIIGLMVFSRALTWLLAHFHQVTFSLLAGFLIGSLNLLWPWKQVLTTYTNSHGVVKPLSQANILPDTFFQLTGQNPQLGVAIALMFFGLALILCIEKISQK